MLQVIVDHETWTMNLEEANKGDEPKWYRLYTARRDLDIESLQPEDWNSYLKKLINVPDAFYQFYKWEIDSRAWHNNNHWFFTDITTGIAQRGLNATTNANFKFYVTWGVGNLTTVIYCVTIWRRNLEVDYFWMKIWTAQLLPVIFIVYELEG